MMWRRLLARWFAKTPSASVQPTPTEPPLLFPGSDGNPFPALRAIVESCAESASTPDVLLFGDSVMERVSRHDADRRDLGNMVAAALPALRVLRISHSAFNPAIYAPLARVVARCPRVPSLTVLPVNLRCFSPQWDLHPAWQFTQEIRSIETWLDDPTRPLAAIEDIRETPGFFAAYDAQPVDYPLSKLKTVGEFRATVRETPREEAAKDARAREIFVFHYTHALTPAHRRLEALKMAVETLRGAGSRVLLYLTPVNHEAGVRLVSDAFLKSLRHNVKVLQTKMADADVALYDWSVRMPADRFFHEDLATEHLNDLGRAELAALIADAVRARLA